MNEKLEKYISELSPELQEKARACKDMQELNVLLAENDVELSEDALEAVAGGCLSRERAYHTECGDELSSWGFPENPTIATNAEKWLLIKKLNSYN